MATVFYILLFLIVFVYVGYPLLLLVINSLTKRTLSKGTSSMKCSLIVTAHNEEYYIEKKIKNCLELEYPRDQLEIIIALDGCTDNTESIARRYESRGVKLVVNKQHLGKINTQSLAVSNSVGEVLVFTDANAILDKGAISKIMRNYVDSSVGCVCGDLNYYSRSGVSGEALYKKYENFLKNLESNIGSAVSAEGSLFSIRREYYIHDNAECFEDVILPFNVALHHKRIVYEPEAKSYELFEMDQIGQLVRRARITNANLRAFFSKRKLLNPLRYGFYSMQLWFHKILRWLVPFLLMSLFVINCLIMGEGLGYKLVFYGQIAFYGSVFLYQIFGKNLPKLMKRIFYMPYFFFVSNLGILLGFVYLFSGIKNYSWKPARN